MSFKSNEHMEAALLVALVDGIDRSGHAAGVNAEFSPAERQHMAEEYDRACEVLRDNGVPR